MESDSPTRSNPPGHWSGRIALLWAVTYLYLGLTSASRIPAATGLERIDLVGHVIASGLLAVLVGEWLRIRHGWPRRPGMVGAVMAGAGLGVVIELLQMGTPGRTFEWLDLGADLIGALAGTWSYAVVSVRVSPVRLSRWVASLGVLAVAAATLAVAMSARGA